MDIIKEVRKQIKENSSEEARKGMQRFFKFPIKLRGVRYPVIHKIAKKTFKEIKHLSKKEILSLCEVLLKSGFQEDKIVAFDWAKQLTLKKKDFPIFERWLNEYVNDWGLCDSYAPYILEQFLQYPDLKEKMFLWTRSKKMYVRRAAAVSYLHDGGGSKASTHSIEDRLKVAKALMLDDEDLVQKAYGWLLKNASKTHKQEVYNFVMLYRRDMGRTALRYAIEYFSVDEKRVLMA